MYAAEQLFHSEGFTEVRYLEYPTDTTNWPPKCLLTGEADISLSFPPTDILHIDRGDPLVILGGSHIGCVELFATNRVRSTPDLKGKTVAVPELWSDDHIFVSMFARYVGLDPQKDINWAIVRPPADFVQLFTEGKIDAVMFGPPRTQQMRAKKIGHVLVNTTTDKPWSHQFCCLVATTREFVRKHPVATKRALRAIIKGADVCAVEPRRVARLIADKGLMRYEDTLQTLQEIPYGKWRDFDAEGTLRFYALRLHEAGIIKSNPQKIIAQGTDWRFLNELKRELKA
jgi:NitT/TauT family transport system substrate-binding protein